MVEPFCRNTSRAAFYWCNVRKKQWPRVRRHMHLRVSTAIGSAIFFHTRRKRTTHSRKLKEFLSSITMFSDSCVSPGFNSMLASSVLKKMTVRNATFYEESKYLVFLTQHQMPSLLPLHCETVWLGFPWHCCSSSLV